jgi:methylmalonyl-CoA/ethylmalonyl-CoA epimerase
MLGNLTHIAIAVPDLEAAIHQYQDVFEAFVSAPQDLTEHGVRAAMVKLSNTTIELITPLGDNSPIQRFLDKNPSGGVHHLCYEVTDIAKARDQLTTAGLRVIGDGTPKMGYRGNPVLFFNPKDCFGALIELEEMPISKAQARIEIERIGPAHTLSQEGTDSLVGYGAVGIELEVDFKTGTPKDNEEDV